MGVQLHPISGPLLRFRAVMLTTGCGGFQKQPPLPLAGQGRLKGLFQSIQAFTLSIE
jgi:hypothetical protein